MSYRERANRKGRRGKTAAELAELAGAHWSGWPPLRAGLEQLEGLEVAPDPVTALLEQQRGWLIGYRARVPELLEVAPDPAR